MNYAIKPHLSASEGNGVVARFASASGLRLPAGRRLSLLACVMVLSVGLAFVTAPGASGQTTTVLTNLDQVHALTLDEGAKGIPVSLRATITYIDPDWRMVFVQDDSGSAYLERTAPSEDSSWNLSPGATVALEGVSSAGVIQCNVHEEKLTPSGRGTLPKPLLLASEESFKNTGDARWVKTAGVITGIKIQGKRFDLDLQVSPNRSVRLMVLRGNPVSAATLVGAMVDATGVYGLDLDSTFHPTGRNLIWMNDLADIQKTRALPVTLIADLPTPMSDRVSTKLVRLRGNVVSQSPAGFLEVKDSSASLRVYYNAAPRLDTGSAVEIFGYAAKQGSTLVLKDATIVLPNTLPGGPASMSAITNATSANNDLPTLTKIVQVRSLSAKAAARGYPVRITGVLTYNDPRASLHFVQDRSGGIFIDSKQKKFESFPEALQLVEITGFSGPGDFAPVIQAEQLRVLGEGAFPNPKSATMQTLITGAEDSQWISLNGVVRSQSVVEDATILSLAAGDFILQVTVPGASAHPAPQNYADAFVEIRGVCATVFDSERRVQSIKLLVPNWEQVRTLSAGTDDPFALPVRSISELLEFHAGAEGLHRAHVRGTVVLRRTDHSFYLQDATGGLLIQSQAAPSAITVGQTVELAGFPSIVNKLPVLQEAAVRPATEKSTLKPTIVTPETPFSQVLNGNLVRLQARVISSSSSAAADSLTLQFGPWILDAMLEREQPGQQLGHIEPGATVDLTGVYLARLDDSLKVQSFQLLLRSANDVQILTHPSWWTTQRIFWLLGAFGIAFALILAWITSLRKQVSERTLELRGEIEERKRMEAQVTKTHRELLVASRRAGMAEVATTVLHNVGNVLNSVNVSANLIVGATRNSKLSGLAKVSDLLREHAGDLPAFLTEDPKGRQLPEYLEMLAERHRVEQTKVLTELESLTGNINHIKEIVARQQSNAKAIGITEIVEVADLIEEALQMNRGGLDRHNVSVVRDFDPKLPAITIDKHKVLQILVNLLSNAKHACNESNRPDKSLIVRTAQDGDHLRISIVDNGVGIASENMLRIFNHGFTTRKHGNGYGLHSGALAAKELGGSLLVQSEGLGKGAEFTLELPLRPAPEKAPGHRSSNGSANGNADCLAGQRDATVALQT